MSSVKGLSYGRSSGLECYNCHEIGHRKDQCPDLIEQRLVHWQTSSGVASRGGNGSESRRSRGASGGSRGSKRSESRESHVANNGSRGSNGSGSRRSHWSNNGSRGTHGTESQGSHGSNSASRSQRSGFEHEKEPSLRYAKREHQSHNVNKGKNSKNVKVNAKERECKSKSQFVRRPNTGTKGTMIELIANHFRLVIKDITIYHYHIEISGNYKLKSCAINDNTEESKNKMRKLKQKENRLVFEALVEQNNEYFREQSTGKTVNNPVFDGNSSMYTAMRLKEDNFETITEVDLDGQSLKLKVEVKLTQQIDLGQINLFYDGGIDEVPREAMQAIDIILRYGPTSNRVPIGNSLYPKWNEKSTLNRVDIDRTGNKQVVFGHYQSMRLTKVGPTLLVDRSATAFNTGGTLLSYLAKLFQCEEDRVRVNDRDINRLRQQLRGLRVYTTHLPYKRPYTIKEISNKPAANTYFEIEKDGKKFKTTVKEYFEETYKKKLNHDYLPCIIPQGSKEIFLPLEVCHLFPDQPVAKGQISPENTSIMVRACGSQTPVDRFNEICEAVANIKADSKQYLMEFNIEIEDKPLLVPGRVIEKPNTEGLNRMSGEKIHKSIPLRNWVFVNLVPDRVKDDKINNFINNLTGGAADMMGIEVNKPIKVWNYRIRTPNDIRTIFHGSQQECKKRNVKLQMILFVIPDDSDVYTNIKLEGDIHQGIVTQCVKHKNVRSPPKGGVQANLLLKINAKLGGINRILKDLPDKPAILNKPVMIIGADVTHPAPADKLSSSVAACIGSYDKDHCIYSASIKVQERSTKSQAVEMIKEFDVMIEDLLDVYHRHNGEYPQHIIYFRDGVSESQFEQVLIHEHEKLLERCKAKDFVPKVTFITVQKRHHTRFRPKNTHDRLVNKKGNIPPGTTVDTHVIHPTDFDFYLCSHEGIQGTSRPTHYYVLHDDHGFKADDLQKLTYYLCYTYARCEKPISIPSPVQYAHLAAYRARNHIVACNIRAERAKRDETEEGRRRRENKLAADLNKLIKVNEGVKNRMYYC